jgi:hypothetical protein
MSCYVGGTTFVHIPKNAGTSIIKWLKEATNEYPIQYKSQHYSASQMFTRHPETNFSFSIIRNPWDRMVSIYQFAIDKREHLKGRYDKEMIGTPTFKEFLHGMIGVNSIYWYTITTPQSDWLDADVDLILRYENLERDIKELQSNYNYYEPLSQENSSKRLKINYYDDESINMVGEIFSKDVKRFGYDYPW